jgi:lysophospholipase L1-like esterase
VYDVARNNIAGWVRDTKPDVVQFMLGTNDVNIGKRNAQSILDSYTSLVNAIRTANPNVKIIVSYTHAMHSRGDAYISGRLTS